MEDDSISQNAVELQGIQKGIIEDAISQGITLDMKNLGKTRTVCISVHSTLTVMRKDLKAGIPKPNPPLSWALRKMESDNKQGIEIG